MRKALSLILVLCMTISLLFTNSVMADSAVTFTDVTAGTEMGDAIYKLVNSGVVVGYPDGTFKPDNHLTRAELTKMINLVFGYKDAATEGFADVTDADWFKPYVLVAKKAGYIKGFEDGSFRGNQNLSREQACAIVSRCANLKETKMIIRISDLVSDWAEVDVKKVIATGYMKLEEGEKFRAKEDITRGELALLLVNFIKAPETTQPTVTPPVIIGGSTGGGGGGGGETTPTKYTVTFNFNGGELDGETTLKVKVTSGKTVSDPGTPERESEDEIGYEFLGYTTDKNGTKFFDFSTKIKKSITLYAAWRKDHKALKENLEGILTNLREYKYYEIEETENDVLYNNVITVKENLEEAFNGVIAACNKGENITENYIKKNYSNQVNSVKQIYDSMPNEGEDSIGYKFMVIIMEIGDTYLTFLLDFFGIDFSI